MTENEIVDYLKQNRTKGVAFNFMPEEVKHWCGYNSADKIFNVYKGLCLEPGSVNCFDGRYVYYLSEDYEIKPEFVPHWVEFDIDENGLFEYDGHIFLWCEWGSFLKVFNEDFNAFGGWLYIDSDKDPTWYMCPRICVSGRVYTWSPISTEAKPVHPSKIRFWRFAE